jgi:hypothetical protein
MQIDQQYLRNMVTFCISVKNKGIYRDCHTWAQSSCPNLFYSPLSSSVSSFPSPSPGTDAERGKFLHIIPWHFVTFCQWHTDILHSEIHKRSIWTPEEGRGKQSCVWITHEAWNQRQITFVNPSLVTMKSIDWYSSDIPIFPESCKDFWKVCEWKLLSRLNKLNP